MEVNSSALVSCNIGEIKLSHVVTTGQTTTPEFFLTPSSIKAFTLVTLKVKTNLASVFLNEGCKLSSSTE